MLYALKLLFDRRRRGSLVLVSNIYPIIAEEHLRETVDLLLLRETKLLTDPLNELGPNLINGSLDSVLFTINNSDYLAETGPNLVSASLDSLLITFNILEPIQESGPVLISGSLDVVLIVYRYWPAEGFNETGPNLISGSLA